MLLVEFVSLKLCFILCFADGCPVCLGGATGVFDVEEVVDLLRDENAQDICVIRVPPELKYVDYLVIVTGRSTRHIQAMAAYIKWVVSIEYSHHAFLYIFHTGKGNVVCYQNIVNFLTLVISVKQIYTKYANILYGNLNRIIFVF